MRALAKELRTRSLRAGRKGGGTVVALWMAFTENLSERKGVVMDSRWALSEHRVDPGTARCRIVWQHERIRVLLAAARSIAEPTLAGAPSSPKALASAIADIRSALEAHFAYEEKHWLPVLGSDAPLGRERADEMLLEHGRQRDFIARLYRDACACPSSPGLAPSLTFLTAWLLSHMEDEERCLVLPSVGSNEFLVIEQRFD